MQGLKRAVSPGQPPDPKRAAAVTRIPKSINDLPEELLDQIFSYQAEDTTTYPYHGWRCPSRDKTNKKALKSLCQVSRKIRRIAQPLLFNMFVIQHGTSQEDLRTVAARPDLAAKIEQLFFGVDSVASYVIGNDTVFDETDPLLLAAKQVDFDDQECFIRAIGRRDPWAEMALLVTLTPGLQKLCIKRHENWLVRNSWFSLTLERASKSPESTPGSPFSKVRHLCYRYDGHSEPVAGLPYNLNIAFPSLQSLELIAAHRVEFRQWPKKSSDISSISIVLSDLDQKVVGNIICGCKALKEFRYCERIYTDISVLKLLDYLRSQSNSIEVLEFQVVEQYDEMKGAGSIPVGSLQHFSQLKLLEITDNLLIGRQVPGVAPVKFVDILPHSFEHLVIIQAVNFLELTLSLLKDLATSGIERFPAFRKVLVAPCTGLLEPNCTINSSVEAVQASIEEMRSLSAQRNIDFEVLLIDTAKLAPKVNHNEESNRSTDS
ncbi:uncharacterized protein K452DRAFT_355781 [Aplosporella prunicola CBS 121167]|uniref:Uncharacterized protein n=1 Tax=Aplosporella prunicola CBS 121167 TaxID=1176127 RepID=A0A6A6BUQ4_9PEZI|nr:uncharacterized protein K452DRAFT_355781 [Aplosporella prunicola CBS 121167]KAF2146391.1 hypothetical protein K452DRAFT_355781 [Aplosporella prunicola CBS 121167]